MFVSDKKFIVQVHQVVDEIRTSVIGKSTVINKAHM